MIVIMRVIDAALVLTLSIAAIPIGLYLAYRLGGCRPGFLRGVLFCSLPMLLCSVIGEFLIGGWGEDYLGTRWGVPIGIAIGGLCASFMLSFGAGSIGAFLYRRLHG
jgi:hypothetical protein